MQTTAKTASGNTSYSADFISSLQEVDAAQWNRLAGDDSPFTRHEFLAALESSGCAQARSGWQPSHLLLRDARDQLLAAVPLYVKNNSYGEYVFDWAWADAYQSHGQEYYPKLVTAIPFTPSTGPRVLTDQPALMPQLLPSIVTAVKSLAESLSASSWHLLFPREDIAQQLQQQGMLSRLGCQFHWHNAGYQSFEDFLAALTSRKRKNIRKERAAVSAENIAFQWLEGPAITSELWECFYDFYQNTYNVRGRSGYLNLKFFQTIARSMPENLCMVAARRDDEVVAAALFFKSRDKLFGRYWGCAQEFQFLHFETCYYQGIDYCIRQGLQLFDAGAQGEHKIQRGFRPVPTWSSHWIALPAFERAIADFLQREETYIRAYMREAESLLPFRTPSCAETPAPQD